jgi:hypothetical protein
MQISHACRHNRSDFQISAANSLEQKLPEWLVSAIKMDR